MRSEYRTETDVRFMAAGKRISEQINADLGKSMKRNIILEGFMGCGKSTVGIRLSYKMFMTVVDTDKLIEREQGLTITGLFAQKGEEAFRQMETVCLRKLLNEGGARIISLGGGIPVREENRAILKQLGMVVYLRVRPETVYERVKNDTERPLLQCENPLQRIREMMSARKEAYEAAADLIIDTDDMSFEEILDKIKEGADRYMAAQKDSQQGIMNAMHCNAWREKSKGGRIPACGNEGIMKILVINGPNINFLGIREKAVYGSQDYDYLLQMIADKAKESGSQIEVFQSNHEGAIIDRIQDSYFDGTQGIVINPGAYTHYSYAIRDALASIVVPKVEIHISDITAREEFRKISVTAPVCEKQIYGQGLAGYLQAIDFLLEKTVEK